MASARIKQDISKLAVGYVRVSTVEQADEGVSLDAQEARLRAYCAMRGLELVELVIDAGVSAGKALATREGGRRVLDLVAKRKVGAVVGVKLDRFFRDAVDALTVTKAWDRAGVGLHLVDMGGTSIDTSSAVGRMFLTMLAGVAEMERGLIAERTKAAMRHKRARGQFNGGPAARYGYVLGADGSTLVPVPAEQEVLAIARQLHEGGMSLRQVAQELTTRGFTARTGRPFAGEQVRRMVAA